MDPAQERPDPGEAATVADFVRLLGQLRISAGLSYRELAKRMSDGGPPAMRVSHSTVADVFKPGRRRLDLDLVVRVIRALHPDEHQVARWREACVAVLSRQKTDGPVGVFRQLPTDLATFVGREGELQQLRDAAGSGERGTAVVICTVEGMAGVGKTQLAVHAAHQLIRDGHYADAQLYVNLRGYDPDRAAADPAAVLDTFLRQLGVPGQQIPAQIDARAAMFRDRLHDRHALILLDNCADENQVHHLLPASPSCLVLITSRRRLTGLDGAEVQQLGLFSTEEAIRLLARIAGADRVHAEREAAAAIAGLCGHLPIALTLAAQRLRGRPMWRLRDLVDRLTAGGLDILATGRQPTREIFDLSYDALPPDQQRLLRLLALHPGDDIDIYAAAALADIDPHRAAVLMEALLDEHLLRQIRPDRYEMHDLLRAYAIDICPPDDADRQAALTRLQDHYLHAASTAMDLLNPFERCHRPDVAAQRWLPPDLTEYHRAHSWLAAERASLLAVAYAPSSRPAYVVAVSAILARDLDSGAFHTDALTLHATAARLAEAAGDATGRQRALVNLGITHGWLGRHDEALSCHSQALDIARQYGDVAGEGRALISSGIIHIRTGHLTEAESALRETLSVSATAMDQLTQARALGNLGIVYGQLGRYDDSINSLNKAFALNESIGDRTLESMLLHNMGNLHIARGQDEQGLGYLEQGLALCRILGNRLSESHMLDSLGFTHLRLGHYQQAFDHFQDGITLAQQTGDRVSQANILCNLGDISNRLGRHRQALDHYQLALKLSTQTGARGMRAEAHKGIGYSQYELGDTAEAVNYYHRAVELFHQTQDRRNLAACHHKLAEIYDGSGNPSMATSQYTTALDLYTELGLPEADQLREHLSHA